MTFSEVLKLPEGAHAEIVNTEDCLVIRLREGFTLTVHLPDGRLLVQYYSERANLLWQDTVSDIHNDNNKEESK